MKVNEKVMLGSWGGITTELANEFSHVFIC
jgi:hypothetical protein